MASEKSPRLLLMCVQELYDNLHEHNELDEAVIESSNGKSRNAGFILSRAENLLLDIRKQLDVPSTCTDTTPLMLRIQDHVSNISVILTGTPIDVDSAEGTTLHNLIRNVQQLNRSVCTVNDPTCSVQ